MVLSPSKARKGAATRSCLSAMSMEGRGRVSGMAGSASAAGTSAADFERMRLAHVSAITEDLHEAADLLSQLNKNLAYWAEKTGEVEKLALVWGKFQNQLSVLSRVMYGQSDPEDTTNETTGAPTAFSTAWTHAPGAAPGSSFN